MDEEEVQRRRREQDEKATRQRATILGLPYVDMRNLEDTLPLVPGMIPIEKMHQYRIVPLAKGGNEVMYQIGVTSQTPQSILQKIKREYQDRGDKLQFLLISASGYRAMMLRYDPPQRTAYDDIEIAKEGDSNTIAQVSQTLNLVSSEELFDFLIKQADRLGASDIHIENERDSIRVRMRVDGALHPVAQLERSRYRIIMGELASRAGVSSAAMESQSGHMQMEITTDQGTHLLNLRVETVPTLYGQDAVLRLFNFDESLLNLDLLGIPPRQRKEIDEVVSHPRGLVLMVGPTGSGKSTTLYSMLNALNTTDRKLITLEDPIEYGLSGMSQIPIDTTHGQSFADGLRSVLRLDPDVVMVGEIRDVDTARTAIQASITGHLVLSSFHANTTSTAFSRMIDMIGVNPIFSSAIRLLIAQRLVRRLVDHTKEAYEPDEATRKYVQRVLEKLPPDVEKPDLDNFKLWRPVPSEDAPFGYKGRVVIMEQLVVTDEIQKFIRGDVQDVHPETIEETARNEGMLTLEQVGVLAALRGETTLEEIARVI
ncbi:GspE/PulE family protein [Candidatus Nanosynsacchari sp. TM7_ANC_38.39_G1_1]|jgi:type IV-A pilus assembly ATPase pilB|uniref:GspE/PulE family protein n=1 Tax=Candidatus Nanosynsacchari sp. TM7_ANC_38.39_G1_1 TaxID=1986206 RepID=UPI00101B856D|nr:GspE/PulE family protein [Candidatus Nanosynsacchari sp. TM7_ANC_38.39_G1_1]RYC74292.1 Type II secretion system protein E [Candidatus Nanosynsacchari sp. TM7_ANC_38.39_G1_1]